MIERNDKTNRKILVLSLIDTLILSFGHVYNNSGIILLGLAGFAALVLFSPKPTFLPIILFYLPWSPIMKFSPESFTFYTIIVPAFFVELLLSRSNSGGRGISSLKNIIITCMLIILTLVVKLLLEYSISMSYLMFMMMLVFMPKYLNRCKDKLSFEWCIIFFSAGIIIAGIASKILMNYSHMLQYIDIYEWETVGLTRLSGFYGDANFYSAHILIAVCGLLLIAINKQGTKAVLSLAAVVVLIYFGMLSVSKMFLLVLLTILGIWIIAVLSMKGKIRTKIGTIFSVLICVLFILSSNIFADEINMYLIRFGMVDSINSLTTGRSDILPIYISFLIENMTALLFGQGYTSVFAGSIAKGSHNSILQAVYQFGCAGTILITVWISQLSKTIGKVKRTYFNASKILLIIAFAVACFVPWLSLDILFFDEFFYITTLFLISKNYIAQMAGMEQKSVKSVDVYKL